MVNVYEILLALFWIPIVAGVLIIAEIYHRFGFLAFAAVVIMIFIVLKLPIINYALLRKRGLSHRQIWTLIWYELTDPEKARRLAQQKPL